MGNGIKHECSINITHMNKTWIGDWGANKWRQEKKKEKALKQSLDSIAGYKLFEPNFPVGFYLHSEAETNR